MSFSRHSDEQINKMLYIHTVKYYLAIKKESDTGRCYSMNDPGRHYVKGKKPNTKGHFSYDSSKRNVQTRQIHGDTQQIGGCPGLGEGRDRYPYGISPGGNETVPDLQWRWLHNFVNAPKVTELYTVKGCISSDSFLKEWMPTSRCGAGRGCDGHTRWVLPLLVTEEAGLLHRLPGCCYMQ